MTLPNYKHPIEEATSASELESVVNRMLNTSELLDVRKSRPQESYADLAHHLEEEGEYVCSPELYSDLNNVVYWLELAHNRLMKLIRDDM